MVEASLKDIELFVDRHLVKLAFGNLLFQKDKFAPQAEVGFRLVGVCLTLTIYALSFGSATD